MGHADEVEIQRAYYARTATAYNAMHVDEGGEHNLALLLLSALIEQRGIASLLDIGSGTGRALLHLKKRHPDLRLIGIEPSAALRAQGYAAGLAAAELVDGDATRLAYPDDAFDLVCEFGALHHIRRHDLATAEMARVARCGVFISDSNNFGHGSGLGRFVKIALHACRLWPLADYAKTRGRGYHMSEGDGLAYSYSAFYALPILKPKFPEVHMLSTAGTQSSWLFANAEHVAIYAHGPVSGGAVPSSSAR
jgi:ubiquinone/menaquinone biosynthesis C-methylase UbiE